MKCSFVILFLIAGLVLLSAASAQETGNRSGWQTCGTISPLGIGWVKSSDLTYWGARADLSVGTHNHWFTLATTFLGGLDFKTDPYDFGGPGARPDKYWDIGFLYGRRVLQGSNMFLYLATGISHVSGTYTTGETESVGEGWLSGSRWVKYSWSEWGMPLEIRGVGKLGRNFGLTLDLVQTVATRRSYGSVTLGVQFGP